MGSIPDHFSKLFSSINNYLGDITQFMLIDMQFELRSSEEYETGHEVDRLASTSYSREMATNTIPFNTFPLSRLLY